MKHATTRILFSYWDTLRGERAAPDRGEIEPGAIRHVLADTFILETDATGTTSFRLAGTRLCALLGGELKGRDFASLWPLQAKAEVGRLMDAVLNDAAGIVGGIAGHTQAGNGIDLEMLLLPLRHRGKTHARILGALSPNVVPVWIGLDPIVSFATLSVRVIVPSKQSRSFGGSHPSTDQEGVERHRHLVVHQGGRV
jgi:hypothetical protein